MSQYSKTDGFGPRSGFSSNATRIVGWLLLTGISLAAHAQDTTSAPPEASKEYFTRQPADTPLVIRMDAFETEIESRVFDSKDALLKASGLSGQRLGAVYQFIEASFRPRELRIKVSLGHGTDRSKLGMQVTRFEPNGPDRTDLMNAYRLLSAGLELPTGNRPDEWTLKVIALMQAAQLFNELGMTEMALWSTFYAHHYLLEFLGDPVTAAEGGREIFTAATRSKLEDLALAALQMQGSATADQAAGKDNQLAGALYGEAQDMFTQAAELAAKMDYQHERARAMFHSGLAYESAGQNGRAFERFDQAIEVATACGDTALANQIRQHAAELHESLGDNTEAISLMQQISAESPIADEIQEPEPGEPAAADESASTGGEMVNYLLEQGRLLEKTYRHAEAAGILRQALDLNQKATSPTLSGPIALMLAKSLYGDGQFDAALKYLQEGMKKTPSFRHEEELYQAYGILAAIQRHRGDFAAMSRARDRQQMFLTEAHSKAEFAYESALDRLAAPGSARVDAVALFRETQKVAGASGMSTLHQLATLHLCAAGEPCASAVAQNAAATVQASGLPVPGLQAKWLSAQVLQRDGQWALAADQLDDLIEDMRFFQSKLPGTLGAWYWQNREFIFRSYLELILERPGSSNATPLVNAADRALTSLERIMRYTGEDVAGADVQAPDQEAEHLRSLIAAREAAEPGRDTSRLAEQIRQVRRKWEDNQEIAALPLGRRLQRLAKDAALLTFYFAPKRLYAWVGRNAGLELVQIPWSVDQSAALSQAAEAVRWDSANGRTEGFSAQMDQLGKQLLAPVAHLLPRVIYFFPNGRLEGFPLDALRWNGEYLAAHHKIINLTSLEDLTPAAEVGPDDLSRFFLAGNRQEFAGDFDLFKTPSAEIDQIADLFVGPNLHIVQGAALQWDEFQDERFNLAGVLHLAVPGIIDLREPEQSKLLLSDNAPDPARAVLRPSDIGSGKLSAALVVLSACEFTGTNTSAFLQNTRFIDTFLRSGAESVIASLWSVGDVQAAQFMRLFYQHLRTSQNVSAALSTTKQSYLAQNEKPDGEAWAAFQLFAR